MGITLIAVFIEGCNKDVKTENFSEAIQGEAVIEEVGLASDVDNSKDERAEGQEKTSILAENVDPDCVEFVALWSAGDIAEKLGKEKKWVFINYTVDLWDIPPEDGEGTKVGKLRASSYARIIEKRGNDYRVESPVNQVQGWISAEHVKTISWKNPKTRKLCK